jgi:hypothetical protein
MLQLGDDRNQDILMGGHRAHRPRQVPTPRSSKSLSSGSGSASKAASRSPSPTPPPSLPPSPRSTPKAQLWSPWQDLPLLPLRPRTFTASTPGETIPASPLRPRTLTPGEMSPALSPRNTPSPTQKALVHNAPSRPQRFPKMGQQQQQRPKSAKLRCDYADMDKRV